MNAFIIGLFIVFCSFTLNGQVVGISSENMPLDSTDSLFSLHSSMPSRTRGEGFVFSVKTPHDNSCVLSLYKNGMYNIEFFFDASPDVLIEIPLGDGIWREYEKGKIELTDRSTGTRMKAIMADTLLYFIMGPDHFVKYPFRWDWSGPDLRNPWSETQRGLLLDTVRNRREAYQRRPYVHLDHLVGAYGDPFDVSSLYLVLTKMHKYRLYIGAYSFLLSAGTWWRDKNLIILTDSTMKQNFYGLIGEKGIQSMVFPGGNRGQYLPKLD